MRSSGLRRWGKSATPQDLELAARDLLLADTPMEQFQYLQIFSDRTFPLPHALLLQLAASDDPNMALASAVALVRITDPSVREFAFAYARTDAIVRQEGIAMLGSNWKIGDHEVVLDWFERENDRDIRHSMGIDLRNFWKRHPEPSSEPRMLIRLFETGPCSTCREFVVSRLVELKALPEYIRAECEYDANENIRLLVAQDSAHSESPIV